MAVAVPDVVESGTPVTLGRQREKEAGKHAAATGHDIAGTTHADKLGSFLDMAFPKSYTQVLLVSSVFFVALVATTVPQGLSYDRFDTRADDCYDQVNYMKLQEINTHPHCKGFTYPYRLVSPSAGSRIIPWCAYLVHQFGQWFILRRSQLARDRGEISWNLGTLDASGSYGLYKTAEERLDALKPNAFAKQMFALNMGMVFLKFVQSQMFYDGLASDVPEFSALYSVALWILFVMIVEMPRRGLLFGYWKTFDCVPEKFSPAREFIPFVRKYHGYAISFGTTYNFWYHPMEGSPGFILGYIYQFCMILQSGFLFHPLHRNKFWTLLLELGVIPHSVLIAIFSAHGDAGGPFKRGFGFALSFRITQMHGFNLKVWQKGAFAFAYAVLLVSCYTIVGRPFSKLSEVARMSVNFTFAPIAWVLWCLGSLFFYPFRPLMEKWPLLTGGLWFLTWASHMAAFVAFGATEADSPK